MKEITTPPPTTTTTTQTPSQTDIIIAPHATTEEEQPQTGESFATKNERQNELPIANAGPSFTVQPSYPVEWMELKVMIQMEILCISCGFNF